MPGSDCSLPIWSPDGRRIAYSQVGNTGNDGVYVVNADGSGVASRIVQFTRDEPIQPDSWSPDGRQILGTRVRAGITDVVLFDAVPQSGSFPDPVTIFGHAQWPAFAPDGRTIAYVTWDSGRYGHVCVSAWDAGKPVGEPLSVEAGLFPRWSSDGERIYYRQSFRTKLAFATITRAPRLTASPSELAWDLEALRVAVYDILPDERLIAIQRADSEDEITMFDITLNFSEELKRKMRAH